MNTKKFLYITTSTTLLVLVIPALLPLVQSQQNDDDNEERPTGQIINSKYLTISGVTFNQDENRVNIGGTILNNPTADQSFTNVVIIAELYDKDNRLITAASGVPGFINLDSGQQSAFTITTDLPSDEEVGRYVISPGGSAK